MKHTEVYGLRTKGTKAEVKGALVAMEDGGEIGHRMPPKSMETPHPDEVRTVENTKGRGLASGVLARGVGGCLLSIKKRLPRVYTYQVQTVCSTTGESGNTRCFEGS